MVYFAARGMRFWLLLLITVCAIDQGRSLAEEIAGDAQPTERAAAEKQGQVRGRVLRATTGEPAFNADVRLIERPDDGCFTFPLDPKRTRSNKAGEFTFEDLKPGTYLVYSFLGDETSRVRKCVFEKVEINGEGQQVKPLELQLKPGTTLRVRVSSQQTGKPLPEATLHFGWTDMDDDIRANETGEIVVPALTREMWHLEVRAPAHASQMRDLKLVDSETTIDVSLAPGGEVTGRVVDEKMEPLAGAKLAIQVESQMMYNLDKATSNEKGEFRLQYLPLNTPLRLHASHSGLGRAETRMSVATQESVSVGDVRLMPLPDGGSIKGRVVDPDGAPIPNATVENMGTSSVNTNTTQTDANGRFHFDKLYVYTASRVMLTIRAKGFAPRQIDVSDRDRNAVEPYKIVLDRGHRIRGRVVNQAGEPIKSSSVSAAQLNTGDSLGGRVITDSEGRFALDSLPANCAFTIHASGYSMVDDHRLPLDQDEEVIVRLEPMGLIRGQVIDAVSEKPIGEFNVRITFPTDRTPNDKRSGGINSTRVNPGEDFVTADGQFQLANLTNGCPWDVIVRAKGYRKARLARIVSVPAEDAETNVIKLQPLGNEDLTAVAGTILDPDGKPVARVQVRLVGLAKDAPKTLRELPFVPPAEEARWNNIFADRYDEFCSAVTDAKGEFKFDRVLRGLSMELVYWSATVPMSRISELDAKSPEELSRLQLTHAKPVTLRVTIDRKLFPDASAVSLSGWRSVTQRERHIELQEGQTEFELSGVEAGTFQIHLMGKARRNESDHNSFLVPGVATRRITAKAGETIEVSFDGK